MADHGITHSTFVIEQTYPASPQRVFAALTEPDQRRRWYAESDQHDVLEYAAEVRTGGVDRLVYRFTGDAPVKGMVIANEGRFEAVVPGAYIVTSGSMSVGEHCISSTLVTLALFGEGSGTRLVCTHQGVFFPGSDGPVLREQGWQVLLAKIAGVLA